MRLRYTGTISIDEPAKPQYKTWAVKSSASLTQCTNKIRTGRNQLMFDAIPNLIVACRAVFYPNYLKLVYKKLHIDTSVKRKIIIVLLKKMVYWLYVKKQKLVTTLKRSLKFIANILT